MQLLSGSTGLAGSYGFIQIAILFRNDKGDFQCEFVKNGIAFVFDIKKIRIILSTEFLKRYQTNTLPDRFLTLSYIKPILSLIKTKNIKLIEAFPNLEKRKAYASYVFLYILKNFKVFKLNI